MKVVLPISGVQTIEIVPRFDSSDCFFYIYDETTRVEEDLNVGLTNNNGYYSFDFDIDEYPNIELYENGKYQIKLIDTATSEIVYRGKMIATTQVPQDYELTKGLYE